MFILLILLGIIAGITAGFFGVGGGLIFSPILYFLFTGFGVESPVSWTVGTALFCTFTAAVSSSIQQRTERNFYWKEGITLGVFGAFGVYFGKSIVTSTYYTEDVFVSLFVVLLTFVAIIFYRRSQSTVTLQVQPGKLTAGKMIIAGILGGLVAALAGVGGGIVLVPVMNLLYRIPIGKTVSISSLAIVLISFSGWIQYAFFTDGLAGITDYTIGFVDFGTSLPLIIGAFVGGILGVKLNQNVKGSKVQLGFSIMVIIMAISMIWSLF